MKLLLRWQCLRAAAVLDQAEEALGIQGRATHEGTVDVFLPWFPVRFRNGYFFFG